MILSIHQPAYMPWLGYFDKIARSDVFVYLDTVQFEKNSFINRNQIKTLNGPQWLTIPVKTKGHTSATLLTTQIDDQQPWRKKHLKAIALSYSKSPFFESLYPELEKLILYDTSLLAELCWHQLNFWLNDLGIGTRVIRASELDIDSQKSDLVLDICSQLGCTTYLSGVLGRQYLVERDFDERNIAIAYQDYKHPTYSQLGKDFTPYLSILDYRLNNAPKQQIYSPRTQE